MQPSSLCITNGSTCIQRACDRMLWKGKKKEILDRSIQMSYFSHFAQHTQSYKSSNAVSELYERQTWPYIREKFLRFLLSSRTGQKIRWNKKKTIPCTFNVIPFSELWNNIKLYSLSLSSIIVVAILLKSVQVLIEWKITPVSKNKKKRREKTTTTSTTK